VRTTDDVMYKLEQALGNGEVTHEILEETRKALLDIDRLSLSPEEREKNDAALARVVALEEMVYGKVPTHPRE
jgi:hypothetical protein